MAYVQLPIMCDGAGMTLFSDRVEAWLSARALTRYQLAKAMGGPGAEDQLRKWLRGDHEPSARSVRRVAAALGIGEGEFWSGPTAPGADSDRRAGHSEMLADLKALTDRVLPPHGDEERGPDTRRRRRA